MDCFTFYFFLGWYRYHGLGKRVEWSVIWVLLKCWKYLPTAPLWLQMMLYQTLPFAISLSP